MIKALPNLLWPQGCKLIWYYKIEVRLGLILLPFSKLD
jgi:hypothetical protein